MVLSRTEIKDKVCCEMSLRSSHPKGSMPNAVKSEVGPGEATGVSIPQGSPAVSLYFDGVFGGDGNRGNCFFPINKKKQFFFL